jgi:hypothetical protein
MLKDYYQLGARKRRRLLADAGFGRDERGIWAHPDGRALGDSVALALTDEALLRYLRISPLSVLRNGAKRRRGRRRSLRKLERKRE